MNREELIVHLYTVKKKSVNNIRDIVGGEKKNISKVLRDNGIELRVKTGWSQKTPTEQDIQLFEQLYKGGKSSVEIGKSTGWSYKTVLKYLDADLVNGSPNLKGGQIEEIRELYNKGYSSRKVAEKLGVSKTSVLKFVDDEDKAAPSSFRIYSLNESFFDIIDSEEKAYWLGYMFADGSNDENTGRISLSQGAKDKGAVYAFKKALEAEHPVYKATVVGGYTGKESLVYTLSINSRKLSDALRDLGCVKNKTYSLSFPNIEPSFRRHFIRGVFDGDGSIWTTKKGRPGFSITGYIPFLEKVQDCLIREANVSKTQIAVRRKENPDFGDIRYGGLDSIKKLDGYLYKDARYFLRRKRDKFKEIIEQ